MKGLPKQRARLWTALFLLLAFIVNGFGHGLSRTQAPLPDLSALGFTGELAAFLCISPRDGPPDGGQTEGCDNCRLVVAAALPEAPKTPAEILAAQFSATDRLQDWQLPSPVTRYPPSLRGPPLPV